MNRDLLAPLVRACLGDPDAEVADWQRRGLPSWSLGEATAGIFRLEGRAWSRGRLRPWSLVMKGLRDVGDGLAWRTEAEVYGWSSSIALPVPLRMPTVRGILSTREDECWIGLEEVQATPGFTWSPADLASCARALGRFNAGGLEGASTHPCEVLARPWLRGAGLRRHVESRDLHVAYILEEEPWAHPGVRTHFSDDLRKGLLELWGRRNDLFAALEGLPLVPVHGDAHPRNLIPSAGPGGGFGAVLVDWDAAGQAPLGVEAQALSAGALATFQVDAELAGTLDAEVFGAYLGGVVEAGARPDPRLLRLAHCAAGSLLWAFPVAGRVLRAAMEPAWREAIELKAGRPFEAILAQRAQTLAFLLDLGREALGLVGPEASPAAARP